VKQGLVLLALGVVALMVQGVVTQVLPAHLVPDFGLLLVVAIALCLRGAASGVVLAALLGYATDLLSGSLLGQHALLRMAAYGVARFGSARLNLRGPLPQALFVGLLSAAHAVGLWGLFAFFAADTGSSLLTLRELLIQALVNGIAAPFVTQGIGALLDRLGDDEAGQRPIRLEPRTLSL
jgi:rod shape-determining protein MreD